MARTPTPCECFGQMPLPERPGCLHCGGPTPPGKWRCVDCQRAHDAELVLDSAERVVNAAAAVHGDAPPPA